MSKAKKLFFVLKWSDSDMWDVISLEELMKHNQSLKKKILENPDNFIGKELDLHWKNGESPSPGTLLAYGKQLDMEVKRTEISSNNLSRLGVLDLECHDAVVDKNETKQLRESQQASLMGEILGADAANSYENPCKCDKYGELKAKYKLLRREHSKNVKELADHKESRSLLLELRSVVDSVRQNNNFESVAANGSNMQVGRSPQGRSSNTVTDDGQNAMVSIGNNITVDRGLLAIMLRASTGPTVLARSLLTHLFTTDELIGKSLTGRQSNAHQGKSPKPGLDTNRVDAIIGYTMKRYPSATRRGITETMSNKIKELNNLT